MKYIPALDGIRGIAILLVVLSHSGLGHIIPGGLGVTTFFFLSGFLITTILVNEFNKTQTINYRKFFLRRFFRLFPPLAICLILTYSLTLIGVVKGGVSINGLSAQIFYLANYHHIFNWPGEIPEGLGVLWSLAVEEHFYLFFPAILLIFFRNLTLKSTITVLIIFCIIVLCWRIYLVSIEQVSTIRTYYATDTRIDSILLGCIFALSPFNPTMLKQFPQALSSKDIIIFSFALGTLLLTLLYRDPFFRETYRYSIQGLTLMPIFFYAIRFPNSYLFSWLNSIPMMKLGIYSYSIYLIHFVIINILIQYPQTNNTFIIFILTFILSSIFAYLVDTYVDNYFRRLRAKFRQI